MAMMDELVEAVARDGHMSSYQAAAAVAGVMRFLAARLPSPLFGELQAKLKADPPAGNTHRSSTGDDT